MSSKVSLSGWQFGHLYCAPKLAAINESKIIFLSSITSLFYLGRGVSWRIILATSTLMNNCSLFYLSFIHFALKPVFASRNVRCFLRLVKNDFLRILRCPQHNAQTFFA